MRHTGLVCHVTSLPGGPVGTFGASARRLVDLLADAGHALWQILPLSPPDLGGSPYRSVGAFALSRMFVDAELLVAQGLLREDERPSAPEGDPRRVDFGAAFAHADAIWDRAWARFRDGGDADLHVAVEAYRAAQPWLEDFARFAARMRVVGHDGWFDWPEDCKTREASALKDWDEAHAETIHRVIFEQAMLALQWLSLRAYANERGVRIVGDIPIFVSDGSADVWAAPELYDLDASGRPANVAGVPPDYFSETGQRWGNPLYRWEAMQARGFAWWTQRFATAFQRFDEVRVDHFRGFEAFWEVPASHETAMHGRWIQAPGRALFDHLVATLGEAHGETGDERPLPVLVEDLGIITPEVEALRDAYAFPGCRVMQFGLGDDPNNPHRPSAVVERSVVYTGTHDNDTTRGWYASMDGHGQWQARERFGAEGEHDIARAVWRTALSTPARWVLSTPQDVLNLGSADRLNTPGTIENNWQWRLTEMQLEELGEALKGWK